MRLRDFFQDCGRPASYHPKMRKLTGSITSAIFLENFIYWSDKTKDPDGWCFKSVEEIEEETGLSYEEQRTARKRLKDLGIIEERHKRMEHRLYFRVEFENLEKLWIRVFSRNGESPDGEMGITQLDEMGNPQFDLYSIPYTSSTTSRSQSEIKNKEEETNNPSKATKQKIVDLYNQTASKREGWRHCRKIPEGEVGRMLTARCRDVEWVSDFPKVMGLAEKLDWLKEAKLETFLRPDNARKILDGEWRPNNGFTRDDQEEEMSPKMRQALKEYEASRR